MLSKNGLQAPKSIRKQYDKAGAKIELHEARTAFQPNPRQDTKSPYRANCAGLMAASNIPQTVSQMNLMTRYARARGCMQ